MSDHNDEKRELLKLKQGLIEESEAIPAETREKPAELHGIARVKNEIYHLGWAIPVIIGAVALAAFIIVQLASRPKEDICILIIAAAESSELFRFSDSNDVIKPALEKYCADYDGNGKVYAETVFIDLSDSSGNGQYNDTQHGIFNSQVKYGSAALILADPELLELVNGWYENPINAFEDLSEELPEDILYNKCGAFISGTGFAKDIGCENSVLFVLDELGGSKKNAAQYKDRAVEVLKNICQP